MTNASGKNTENSRIVIRAEGVHTPPLGAEKGYAHLSAIPRENQHTPLLAAGLLIRQAELCDLPNLYDICLKTGNGGKDASALYGDPFLIGQIWAAPYLHYDKRFCFVADYARATAGYVLAALDSAHFYEWLEKSWLPPLRAKYPTVASPEAAASARTVHEQNLVDMIHVVHRTALSFLPPPETLARYPSHLHIDLLPHLQGKGAGKKLMHALFAALKAGGSRGVHLGVSKANENAVAFYRHIGFEVITESPDGFTLGQKL